jgi:hypothetical protein
MASASITTRKTKGGGRRYVVRFRLGGRAYPIVHGGLFPTMREARIRRDLIAGELAAGRNPADALRGMAERPETRTFAEWAKAWKESRVDVSDSTLTGHHNRLLRLEPTFGERDPGTLKVDRVWRRSVWSPRWGRKEASMRPKLAVTVLIIAVAALIAVPTASPAGAGAETYLQTFHNVTEVSTDLNPCTGDPGTLTLTYNGAFHATELTSGIGAGTFWATGTLTGTFSFVPFDSSKPSYGGRFTTWFGDNDNLPNGTETETLRVRGIGSDGSVLTFHEVAHMTVTAIGITFSFDKASCG